MTSFKNILLGAIAGVVAALTVHEIVKYIFYSSDLLPARPWDLAPVGVGPLANAMPKLAYAAMWGGIWGIVFAIILGNVPKGPLTFRGAELGILGPAVAGALIVIPLLSGTPMFHGGELKGILGTLAIFAAFGASTAWLYGFFTSGLRLP